MASRDELIQVSCVVSKSHMNLLPEVMKILSTASSTTYSWDSMKISVTENLAEDVNSRVILNLCKSKRNDEKLVKGKLHKCEEHICKHNFQYDDSIMGHIKVTSFSEKTLRDYMRNFEEEEDEGEVGVPGLERDVSNEMFYPSWYDKLRDSATSARVCPITDFPSFPSQQPSDINEYDYYNQEDESYPIEPDYPPYEKFLINNNIRVCTAGLSSSPLQSYVDYVKQGQTSADITESNMADANIRRNIKCLKERLRLAYKSDEERNYIFTNYIRFNEDISAVQLSPSKEYDNQVIRKVSNFSLRRRRNPDIRMGKLASKKQGVVGKLVPHVPSQLRSGAKRRAKDLVRPEKKRSSEKIDSHRTKLEKGKNVARVANKKNQEIREDDSAMNERIVPERCFRIIRDDTNVDVRKVIERGKTASNKLPLKRSTSACTFKNISATIKKNPLRPLMALTQFRELFKDWMNNKSELNERQCQMDGVSARSTQENGEKTVREKPKTKYLKNKESKNIFEVKEEIIEHKTQKTEAKVKHPKESIKENETDSIRTRRLEIRKASSICDFVVKKISRKPDRSFKSTSPINNINQNERNPRKRKETKNSIYDKELGENQLVTNTTILRPTEKRGNLIYSLKKMDKNAVQKSDVNRYVEHKGTVVNRTGIEGKRKTRRPEKCVKKREFLRDDSDQVAQLRDEKIMDSSVVTHMGERKKISFLELLSVMKDDVQQLNRRSHRRKKRELINQDDSTPNTRSDDLNS